MVPVRIVIDTREQLPYTFDPGRIQSARRALPAGDYSLEGYETSVAVERKSINDFVSTVIRSRKRFYRELGLLAEYEHACVVVEASLREIIQGEYRSNAHPSAVLGAAMSIIIDFGVPVFFCADRQLARRFVEEYLLRAHRKVFDP